MNLAIPTLCHLYPILLGVRKRSVRCVTFGDQTPASDQACDGRNKPAVLEQCSPTNCAVR